MKARVVYGVAVAAVAIAACDSGSSSRSPAPKREVAFDFDRVAKDDGMRALESPVALDSVKEPQIWEQPLRGFSCERPFGGMRTNGRLRITFEPAGPRDVEYRLQFDSGPAGSPCNYSGRLRVVNGRLDDGFLGKAYEVRCRQSPQSSFAVSCGAYLGSDLHIDVAATTWGRTVSVRLPWSFTRGIADESVCRLPFVEYGDDGKARGVDNSELVFDFENCWHRD